MGNMDMPLVGPHKDTQLFDSLEAANTECERLEKVSEICFCVWEFDGKVEDLKPRGKTNGEACFEYYGKPCVSINEFFAFLYKR